MDTFDQPCFVSTLTVQVNLYLSNRKLC